MLARIADTEYNRKVLELYYNSRPDSLDESSLPLPPEAKRNVGFFFRALKSAGEFAFGQNHIENVALPYLDENDEGIVADFLNGEKVSYKSIRSLLREYQKQKRSRLFGANFDPEVMKDHRYLIVALLERKLNALMKSNDAQREKQREHLTNFITDIFKNKQQLLSTSSDDSKFLSLESVLLNIQVMLKVEMDKELFEAEEEKIKQKMVNLKGEMDKQISGLNEILLRLTVPCDVKRVPGNYTSDTKLVPMLRDNANYKNIVQGGTAFATFFVNQFQSYANLMAANSVSQYSQDNNPLEVKVDDIKASIGKIRNKLEEKAKGSSESALVGCENLIDSFATTFAKRNLLIEKFRNILSLQENGKDVKAKELEDLQLYLMETIKAFAILIKKIGELFAKTNRKQYVQYKDAFLAINWAELHNSFTNMLGYINQILFLRRLQDAHSDTPAEQVSSAASATSAEFANVSSVLEDKDLENSFVILVDARDAIMKLLAEQKDQAEAEVIVLKEKVAQLEGEGIRLRKQLSSRVEKFVEEQKKNIKLSGEKNKLCEEVCDLEEEVEDLKKEITGLKEQLVKPQSSAHAAEKEDIVALDEEVALTTSLTDRKKAHDAVKGLTDVFTHFVNAYKSKENRGIWFWNRHGSHGKSVATEVIKKWSDFQADLLRELSVAMLDENANVAKLVSDAVAKIKAGIKQVMKDPMLDGKFDRESLKTFVLAFHDMISDEVETFLDKERNASDVFTSFCANYVDNLQATKNDMLVWYHTDEFVAKRTDAKVIEAQYKAVVGEKVPTTNVQERMWVLGN